MLALALATAGCGLGPGDRLEGVELTVTRDYGAEELLSREVGDIAEADTVMRVLERSAEISTRYGGGFVHSIDGLEAERSDSRYRDWLYYVNGVEAGVGAAAYELGGGEAIWWDHRDWTDAQRVPAVVGSWPHPFVDGYEGRRRPVAVECRGSVAPCAAVKRQLRRVGATLAKGSPPEAIRVWVGPWRRLREDPGVAPIGEGPDASGVFVELDPADRTGFWALDEEGERARRMGAGAGLVAATRRGDSPPVWVVTGLSAPAVRAAARLLQAADLRNRFALATEDGERVPLPLESQ